MSLDVSKSIRISSSAAAYVDSCEGSSFNYKLNRLIYMMSEAVPEKKKELRFIEACIEYRRRELLDLRLKIDRLRSSLSSCETNLAVLDRILADAVAQLDDLPADDACREDS